MAWNRRVRLRPSSGVPAVMETLGHSQISLTLDTYAHVIPELQRDAAERMEALLVQPDASAGSDPVAVSVAVNEG
jgi:integrase